MKPIKEIRDENFKQPAPILYLKEFVADYNNRTITIKVQKNVYQYKSPDGYFWIKRPDGKHHWFEFRKGRQHKFIIKDKQLVCDAEPFVKFDIIGETAEIQLRDKNAKPLKQVVKPRVSKPLAGFFPFAVLGLVFWRKNRMEKLKK